MLITLNFKGSPNAYFIQRAALILVNPLARLVFLLSSDHYAHSGDRKVFCDLG